MTPPKPNKRHLARACAVQALYQWHYTQESPELMMREFVIEHMTAQKNEIDIDYFRVLFLGVTTNQAKLDEIFSPFLDRPIALLNPIELAVLRLSTFEFTEKKEIPHKVVINEAIELVKAFGAQDGYKYVNGVLNALLKGMRSEEGGEG